MRRALVFALTVAGCLVLVFVGGASILTLALTRVGVLDERTHALVCTTLTLTDLVVEDVLVAAVMLRALVLVVVKLGALAIGPIRGTV